MRSTSLRTVVSVWALLCVVLTLPTGASAAGIGAASPRNGELDLFFRHDGDGTVGDPNADSLVMMRRIDGAWRSPVNLGGYVNKDSEISATSRANGVIDVAVRWNDNTLRTRTWTRDTGWGDWTLAASGLTGGPSIASRPSTGMVYTAWRDASGAISLSGRATTGGWSAPVQVPQIVRANSGPSLMLTATSGTIKFTGSDPTGTPVLPAYTNLDGTGDPLVKANWSQMFMYASATPPSGTPNSGAVTAWGTAGGTGSVKRYQPAVGSTPASFVTAGTDVAGASNQRTGESLLPNTPVSLWSQPMVATAGQEADLLWRTQNGCFKGVLKTGTAANAAWSAFAPFPDHPDTVRCEWPGRVGTLPLLKRTDPSDKPDLAATEPAWSFVPGASMTGMNWYSARDAALVLNQGEDWVTAWEPRQWHPNAWVYRKSTSYLRDNGLQTASGTSGDFIRAKDNGHLLALNYECYTAATATAQHPLGCTQPLLNVTLPAAREYWLRGSSSAVESQGICESQHDTEGILDLLACTAGNFVEAEIPGNAKGVWLDDVLPRLADPNDPNAISLLADQETGIPLTNAQVMAKLPVTQSQWETGLATMLEDLRTGINTLKAQHVLRPDQGKVAMNYKWFSYDFGWKGTAPKISDNAAAVRLVNATDLVDIEAGVVDRGLHTGLATGAWNLLRQASFIDQVHALGRNVILEKVDCGDLSEFINTECSRWDGPANQGRPQTPASDSADRIAAQYNLAAALMDYAPGDMVGDVDDYVGRGWDGYQSDLGAPTGTRGPSNAAYPASAQQRTFERGRIVVIPPEPPTCSTQTEFGCLRSDGLVHVQVGTGLRWRPQGSNTLTPLAGNEVALGPRRGAVLLNPAS